MRWPLGCYRYFALSGLLPFRMPAKPDTDPAMDRWVQSTLLCVCRC
jgi:hypothetical protein